MASRRLPRVAGSPGRRCQQTWCLLSRLSSGEGAVTVTSDLARDRLAVASRAMEPPGSLCACACVGRGGPDPSRTPYHVGSRLPALGVGGSGVDHCQIRPLSIHCRATVMPLAVLLAVEVAVVMSLITSVAACL